MAKIDKKDQKILALLDKNARQYNNEIGKKVRLSKEVVKYRIDKLKEKGIILRFHTIINYFKMGFSKFKLYLRLTSADKQKMEEIGEYFNKQSCTEWVALTSGRWDMIIGFIVKNVNEFDDAMQKAFSNFSPYIQEKAITTTLYLAHHTREFLNEPKSHTKDIQRTIYHTSQDEKTEIDESDREILKLLANNARMPVTEIAYKLKSTPRKIQYKIKSLERKKVILAYKVHLNPHKMGRIFCKAIISASAINPPELQEFINYISHLNGAVWPQRVLGNWDFELDFESENYDTFQEILLSLREKFPKIIKTHDFCIVSKEFKLDLFPGAYPVVS